MALLKLKFNQEQDVEQPSFERIKEAAKTIISSLRAKGDKLDKMGIDVTHVTATLQSNIAAYGIKEGTEKTCSFFGLTNEDGSVDMKIVYLALGIMIMSVVIPMAFTNFYATDTTNWCKTNADGAVTRDTGVTGLWYLVPLAIIIVIIVGYFKSR
jgi:hypothetical protein